MTSSVQLLLCLSILLTLYVSNYSASGSKLINCRKFVYHPKCRGVAAKRALRPAVLTPALASARDPDSDRKQEEDVVPDAEYLPVTLDLGNEVVPRRPWTYLPLPLPASDRNLPGLLLARRKPDATPDALETAYDYE